MVFQKIVFSPLANRQFLLFFLGFNFIFAAVVPGDIRTLFQAVKSGNLKDVRNLINSGVDINQLNENGYGALHLACGIGNKEIVKVLIAFNANVNIIDDHGRMPLHWASFNGNEQIILQLILNGADVNHKTNEGFTPLIVASTRGHQKAVETLLLNGADASIKCDIGKSAMDIALEKRHTKVVEVLIQFSRAAWKACESYNERYATSRDRILGGRAAERFEFPWMAALGYLYRDNSVQFDCGGTIVSEKFIITAAHCATSRKSPTVVRVGEISLTEDNNNTDHEVEEIIRHPNYSFLSKKNDIALVRLKTSISFSNQTFPGCLRTNIHDVKPNVKLIVTGFGSTSGGPSSRSNVLLKAQLASMPMSECRTVLSEFNARANLATFRNIIDESQYCAYDPQGRNDSCQGDSGGPLQHFLGGTNMAEIVGIVSIGVACGSALPGLYTRIAYYLDWIESIVWPNIDTSTPYSFL